VAAVYVVSYVAFGGPIVIAGYLAGPLGQVQALYWYTALTILLSGSSLVAQYRLRHRPTTGNGLATGPSARL
jgi:hypothetical protein